MAKILLSYRDGLRHEFDTDLKKHGNGSAKKLRDYYKRTGRWYTFNQDYRRIVNRHISSKKAHKRTSRRTYAKNNNMFGGFGGFQW